MSVAINVRCESDVVAKSLVLIKKSLQDLVSDADMLAKGTVEGKLAVRADAAKHQGDYRKVVQGMNHALDAVIGPLNLAADYVDKISKGVIPAKISTAYSGDFNQVQKALAVIKGAPANVQAAFKDLLAFVKQFRAAIQNSTSVTSLLASFETLGKNPEAGNRRRDHLQLVHVGLRVDPRDEAHVGRAH